MIQRLSRWIRSRRSGLSSSGRCEVATIRDGAGKADSADKADGAGMADGAEALGLASVVAAAFAAMSTARRMAQEAGLPLGEALDIAMRAVAAIGADRTEA